MENCPTCNVRLSGEDVCRRCNTDLRSIHDVEYAAVQDRYRAIKLLITGNVQAALDKARWSVMLHRVPESLAVLCLAELRAGLFQSALNHRLEIKRKWPDFRVRLTLSVPAAKDCDPASETEYDHSEPWMDNRIIYGPGFATWESRESP